MMRQGLLRMCAMAFAGACGLFLGGCTTSDYENAINDEISAYWSSASKKASLESDAAKAIDSYIESKLDGTVLANLLFFKVTFDGVYGSTVDLGHSGPTVDITSAVTTTTTSSSYVFSFDFTATWAAGNGADAWCTFSINNAPDPDFHVYDVSATARGSAVVTVSKSSYVASAAITLSSASASLTADLTIWTYFTFDVSRYAESAVNSALEGILDTTIEAAFTL